MVLCTVADYRERLFSAEAAHIGSMIDKRQRQFSSGRHCAHLVQAALELEPLAIDRQERVPLLARRQCRQYHTQRRDCRRHGIRIYRGVGIDIEQAGRVDEKLFRMLFTQPEQAAMQNYPSDAADIMFPPKRQGTRRFIQRVSSLSDSWRRRFIYTLSRSVSPSTIWASMNRIER